MGVAMREYRYKKNREEENSLYYNVIFNDTCLAILKLLYEFKQFE